MFDNAVPVQWRRDLFDLIEATPNLDWLLLISASATRAALRRGLSRLSAPVARQTSGSVQRWSTRKRQTAHPEAAGRAGAGAVLSIEPMLGRSAWTAFRSTGRTSGRCCIVVICGGERLSAPMRTPDWARSHAIKCQAAVCRSIFKQWGEWGEPGSTDDRTGLAYHGWWEQSREDGEHQDMRGAGPTTGGVELAALRPEVGRVGKKAAGPLPSTARCMQSFREVPHEPRLCVPEVRCGGHSASSTVTPEAARSPST